MQGSALSCPLGFDGYWSLKTYMPWPALDIHQLKLHGYICDYKTILLTTLVWLMIMFHDVPWSSYSNCSFESLTLFETCILYCILTYWSLYTITAVLPDHTAATMQCRRDVWASPAQLTTRWSAGSVWPLRSPENNHGYIQPVLVKFPALTTALSFLRLRYFSLFGCDRILVGRRNTAGCALAISWLPDIAENFSQSAHSFCKFIGPVTQQQEAVWKSGLAPKSTSHNQANSYMSSHISSYISSYFSSYISSYTVQYIIIIYILIDSFRFRVLPVSRHLPASSSFEQLSGLPWLPPIFSANEALQWAIKKIHNIGRTKCRHNMILTQKTISQSNLQIHARMLVFKAVVHTHHLWRPAIQRWKDCKGHQHSPDHTFGTAKRCEPESIWWTPSAKQFMAAFWKIGMQSNHVKCIIIFDIIW